MKFKAKKTSERSAQGRHKDWAIVRAEGMWVLIRCTCHEAHHSHSDLRWITKEQIEND